MDKPHQPFRRVMAFVQAFSALLSSGISHQEAIAEMGPYVSRGKGKGKDKRSVRSRGNRSGKSYTPNGQRECERRIRQMAKGMISRDQILLAGREALRA